MPKHARARGFMFWSISFEGSAVFNGTGYERMWFARGLQDYLPPAAYDRLHSAERAASFLPLSLFVCLLRVA